MAVDSRVTFKQTLALHEKTLIPHSLEWGQCGSIAGANAGGSSKTTQGPAKKMNLGQLLLQRNTMSTQCAGHSNPCKY